jgi:hypothetical protein
MPQSRRKSGGCRFAACGSSAGCVSSLTLIPSDGGSRHCRDSHPTGPGVQNWQRAARGDCDPTNRWRS